MKFLLQRLATQHSSRRRRWGHLGMYGLLRIYMPYAWAMAALLGLVFQGIGVFF